MNVEQWIAFMIALPQLLLVIYKIANKFLDKYQAMQTEKRAFVLELLKTKGLAVSEQVLRLLGEAGDFSKVRFADLIEAVTAGLELEPDDCVAASADDKGTA